MDGYVASGRILRAAPRLAVADRACRVDRAAAADVAHAPAARAVLAEVDGREVAPEPTLPERWDAIRERWRQMTFYLFDADSWR